MKLLISAVLAAALLIVPNADAAGRYVCTGTVGMGPLANQFIPSTIDANVDVPAGATCAMYLTTVTGNVTVEGTLIGFGNTFDKNLVANGGQVLFPICFSLLCGGLGPNHVMGNAVVNNAPGRVDLSQSQVDGNAVVDGVAGDVEMIFSTIHGNLSITHATGGVDVEESFVDGALGLVANGGGFVGSLEVGGPLVCVGNNPAPTVTNVTASRMLGQCAAV